jgi:hypothetical protein
MHHITHQLKNLGVIDKSERFQAIKTKNGAIGCTMSHIQCLELAIARNYKNVFICEDDVTFLDIPSLKKGLTQFFQDFRNPDPAPAPALEKDWDVLILGGNNGPPFQKVSDSYIRVHNCQSTAGYIVNRHYYPTLLQNFREGVQKLVRDATNKKSYAIDMYWKNLQFVHKWYLLIPVRVVQIESYSDVEEKVVDYKRLMMDYDKKEYIMKVQQLQQQQQQQQLQQQQTRDYQLDWLSSR